MPAACQVARLQVSQKVPRASSKRRGAISLTSGRAVSRMSSMSDDGLSQIDCSRPPGAVTGEENRPSWVIDVTRCAAIRCYMQPNEGVDGKLTCPVDVTHELTAFVNPIL